MKIKKRIIVSGAIVSGALLLVPLTASARHGSTNQSSDDSAVTANSTTSQTPETEKEHKPVVVTPNLTPNVTPNTPTSDKDKDDDSDEHSNTTTGTPTNLAGATVIAQNLHPDVTIVKVETEKEDGRTVFSFHFSDGSRVVVDGSTSLVLADKTSNSSQGNSHISEN